MSIVQNAFSDMVDPSSTCGPFLTELGNFIVNLIMACQQNKKVIEKYVKNDGSTRKTITIPIVTILVLEVK